MKPTLSEFLAERWGNSWAICPDTATNRERYARYLTPDEYGDAALEYNIRYGMIDLPTWAHEILTEALTGLLHATCGLDGDGRAQRIESILPREAAIATAALARLRSIP